MKSISVAMDNHLKEGSTTLTTCWKITRTDTLEFFYTELDEDILFEGKTYKSAAGFNKSAITSSATFAVDKLEVTGFLRDDGITDEEIRNGAFDYAQVEVFMVDYENLGAGKIRLRAGWFGEVRTTSSGAFLVELRGLVDQLQVKIGSTYLPECRVDLGSKPCGIKLVPDVRKGGTSYKVGDRMVYPVTESTYDPDKHFPELLDQNNPSIWSTGNKATKDVNVGPVDPTLGPYILSIRSSTPTIGNSRLHPLTLAEVGVTPEMIAEQTHKVRFKAKAFRLSGASNGYIRVHCQSQYFGTGIYTDIVTETFAIKAVPPKRKWVEFEVSINIHPDTDRFAVSIGASPDPAKRSQSQMYFDSLDFIVSRREDQITNFASYGGVEFLCAVAGKTATTAPVFTGMLGDTIIDGGVTWTAVDPVYTHLRSLISNMTSTTTLYLADLVEPWADFYDWGVVKFLTGDNAGRAMEIQSYDKDTGRIKLALPLPYQGKTGDIISIQAGCNKTLTACKKFQNVLNFRGHPRVPGQGQYFKVAGM